MKTVKSGTVIIAEPKRTAQKGEPMDSIDRRDAIRIVDSIDTWQAGWRGNAIESLKALPSVQPEIIHCGDCRYKDDGIDEDGIPFLKCLHGRSYGGTRINDFCSWAERRTDETD